MSNLPTLRDRLFDANGVVLGSGRLYFWEAGSTSVPETTYTTKAMNIAHANPVEASVSGLLPEIYLQPGVPYRVILKDEDENTIFDIDDVVATTLDDSDLIVQFYETAENPNHYGAIGNGVADESQALQDALDAAGDSRDGIVDLLGRTYRIDEPISIPAGVTLRNGTIDASNIDDDKAIGINGALSAFYQVATNQSIGDYEISVDDGTDFEAGQYIKIVDGTFEELNQILEIDGIDTLRLVSPLRNNYTDASATIQIVTMADGCIIENVRIIMNPSVGGDNRGIEASAAENLILRNVRIAPVAANVGSWGVFLELCSNCTIESCVVDGEERHNPGDGLGFVVSDSLGVSFSGCKTVMCGVGVKVDTFSSDVSLHDFVSLSCGNGIIVEDSNVSAHGGGFFSEFADGTQIDLSGANSSSFLVSFDGVRVDFKEAAVVAVAIDTIDAEFINCHIEANDAICLDADLAATELTIRGGSISNPGGRAINIDADDDSSLVLSGLLISCNGSAIDFDGSVANANVSIDIAAVDADGTMIFTHSGGGTGTIEARIRQCNIERGSAFSGNSGIRIEACIAADIEHNRLFASAGDWTDYGIVVNGASGARSVSVCNNDIRIADTQGILVTEFPESNVSGNVVNGATATNYGINISNTAAAKVNVHGNRIDVGSTTAAHAGIQVSSTQALGSRISITGNSVLAGSRAVRIEGYCHSCAIVGNSLAGGAAANSVVFLNGAAGSAINACCVTGNVIAEGVYGIEIANGSEVIHDGNVFYSQSTGITTGTITAGDSA